MKNPFKKAKSPESSDAHEASPKGAKSGKSSRDRADRRKQVTSKARRHRKDWGESFAKVSPDDHEMLISESLVNDFDRKEWTW